MKSFQKAVILSFCFLFFSIQSMAKEREDIPDWTLGFGYGQATNFKTPVYHFKLHHVFSNLISGGPEFTYQTPIEIPSIGMPGTYYRKLGWQLDFMASTKLKLGYMSIYPMLGCGINHYYYRIASDVDRNLLSDKEKDMAFGAVLGLNIQFPIINWGDHGAHVAFFADYRYSTNRLGQQVFLAGFNYFFFLKKME